MAGNEGPTLHKHIDNTYCIPEERVHAVVIEASETAERNIERTYRRHGWEVLRRWETKEVPLTHPAKDRLPIKAYVVVLKVPAGVPIGDHIRPEYESAGEGEDYLAC